MCWSANIASSSLRSRYGYDLELNYGHGKVDYDMEFPPLPVKSELKSDDKLERQIRSAAKICYIQGRMLTPEDVGEYIVRPQPTYRRAGIDMSCVPCEGFERFSDYKLVRIEKDGTLTVQFKEGSECPSWFPNDGGWITVKEFKDHLALTGERLRPLERYRHSVLDF